MSVIAFTPPKVRVTFLISKIGEKITIGRAMTLNSSNGLNFKYQHSVIKENVSKLGVIVNLEIDRVDSDINSFGNGY